MPYKFDINETVKDDPETLGEKVHDILDAKMTLNYLLQDLKSGYKFDDQFAQNKIETVERSIHIISQECEVILDIYRRLRSPT